MPSEVAGLPSPLILDEEATQVSAKEIAIVSLEVPNNNTFHMATCCLQRRRQAISLDL